MSRSRTGASAFTLVELLVVIAIIALLIALMMPALSQARGASRASVCRSNLRQLGVAVMMFAGDHGDRFPYYWRDPNYPHPNPPTPTHPGPHYEGLQWDSQLAGYLGIPVWNETFTGRHFPAQITVFVCPSSQIPSEGGAIGNWRRERTNSYNYNTYLGRNTGGTGRIHGLEHPLLTPVLTELLWLPFMSNWGLWGGANQPNHTWDPVGQYHAVAFHHNEQTNILFGDLHVMARDPLEPGNYHSYPRDIVLYNGGPRY